MKPSKAPYQMYQPGTDGDVALFHWYTQLAANGDLQRIAGPSIWPIAAFMKHFTEPCAEVCYLADRQGWWIVSSLFPLMGGGTWGLWLRPDKRTAGSREALAFIMESLNAALQRYPVLVNVTKQDCIVAKTVRLGYSYLGKIPLLFEGEDCHVMFMTREMFEPLFEKWSKRHGSR